MHLHTPCCPAHGCRCPCYLGHSQLHPYGVIPSVVRNPILSLPCLVLALGGLSRAFPSALHSTAKSTLKQGKMERITRAPPRGMPNASFRICNHARVTNSHPATGWVLVGTLEGLSQAFRDPWRQEQWEKPSPCCPASCTYPAGN